MGEKVSFLASFPAIQSAIKVTGDGSGMRITLEIPETEMPEAIKLMLYRQIALKVTIEKAPKNAKSKRDDIDQVLDELNEHDSN